MSYILDALKKIESEKNRKSRGNGVVNISGELFASAPPSATERDNSRMRLAAVALGFIVASAALFFLLKEQFGIAAKKPAPLQQQAAASPVTEQKAPSAAPSPAPQTFTAAIAPAVPVPAQMQASVAAQNQNTKSAPLSNPKPVVPEMGQENGQIPKNGASLRQKGLAHVETASATAKPAFITPLSGIKVDGIAWQDERAGRRAVVNGILVKEGGAVAGGAKVSEILADRVRFSSPAGMFEISLVSSSSAGAVK